MNSFSIDFIPLSTHLSWFNSRFSNNLSKFILSDSYGCPLGQIRFDLLADSLYSIDLSLDYAIRGLGLSSSALQLAIEFVRFQLPQCRFKADVLHTMYQARL